MLSILLSVLLAAEPPGAAPERRDEWQYLSGRFEVDGFSSGRESADGNFDGLGNAFVAGGLPQGPRLAVRSDRFGTVEFRRPPTEGDEPNMVPARGQVLEVRTKRIFNVLFSLGSAHHGIQSGWIEFRFEDGTVGFGPFGFTDWAWEPALGEEEAFALQVSGPLNVSPETRFRLWLQRTPIPAEKRLVAIKLPDVPNAKIVGLTLGYRENIRPIEPPAPPKPEPGPVAIFSEPGFPYYNVRAELTPERIRSALAAAGIGAALLGIDHLKDPVVFHVGAYPVLVNPYGNTFPAEAEENLRRFRRAGGSFVHLAVPFTHPVVRTAYGTFFDPGHTQELLGHSGDRALGAGGFQDAPWKPLVAQPALADWGLGGVEWDRFLPRGSDLDPHFGYRSPQPLYLPSLDPGDEVTPLLSFSDFAGGPLSAIIRHRSCEFAGAIDLWAGPICLGLEPAEEPVAVATEFLVRGTAWILREKKAIDDSKWSSIARPVPEALRVPRAIEPVLPESTSWRLPESPATGRVALRVDLAKLSSSERVLAASAQGLLNRAGGEESAFLVDGEEASSRLLRYLEAGALAEVRAASLDQLLERLGHRRAVVVDPDLCGSLNVATMLSASEGLLIAYPWLLGRYRLEAKEDLRGRFSNAAEGYAWAEENLLPRLSKSLLAMVEPSPRTYAIRDYLIAQRVFTFWVSSEAEQRARGASTHRESAFASRLLARTPVCMSVLSPPVPASGSQARDLCGRFAKVLIPVARLGNLSFSSGLRAGEAVERLGEAGAPEPRKLHFDPRKVYVACVADEGAVTLETLLGEVPKEKAQDSEVWARAVAPYAFDLLPLETERAIAALGSRHSLGSPGLGDVDLESFGGAFGARAQAVRRRYLELTDRSMKDLGQRFLILPRWKARREGAIAESAQVVSSAEIILLAFQAGSAIPPLSAAYLLEGRPVVHTSLAEFSELTPERFRLSVYAAERPGFAWVSARRSSEPMPREFASELVLVDPLELAELYRQYLAEGALEEVPLVSAGSVWKYHDRGVDMGRIWRAPDFDDSSWASGPAELGYGDAAEGRKEATELSFGEDSRNKHPCYYFRIRFSAKDVKAIRKVILEILYDDGCVAYLNGTEVARANMPEGEPSYWTYAQRALSDAEETVFQGFEIEPRHLREGENVLAVEVHQSNASSSDLSFDARLTSWRRAPRRE